MISIKRILRCFAKPESFAFEPIKSELGLTNTSVINSLRSFSERIAVKVSRFGNKRLPKKTRKIVPANTRGSPMDASSNIPIGSYPDWVKIPLASKLVLVPIKVQVPPKIDA